MLPASYWLLFVLFVVIEVLVVILLVGLYKLLARYETLKEEYRKTIADSQNQAEEVYEKAQEEAKKIMDDARVKSQKLVQDAEGFSVEGTKRLQEALDWMLKDQTRAYTDELKAARKKTEEQLLSMAGEVNQMAATELKVFANKLQQQTKFAQEEASKSIQQAYAQMGEELERYKKQRMERVDEIVKDMVMRVARDVMGDSLSTSEHETLVMKALEEAKKKNVF